MQPDEQVAFFSQVKNFCVFFRREGSERELSQKEEEMKRRQRSCRLQEQLEQWQPQRSVWGKQPMAENTPLLFHMVSASGEAGPARGSQFAANWEQNVIFIALFQICLLWSTISWGEKQPYTLGEKNSPLSCAGRAPQAAALQFWPVRACWNQWPQCHLLHSSHMIFHNFS